MKNDVYIITDGKNYLSESNSLTTSKQNAYRWNKKCSAENVLFALQRGTKIGVLGNNKKTFKVIQFIEETKTNTLIVKKN
jgi:hypothetical protein